MRSGICCIGSNAEAAPRVATRHAWGRALQERRAAEEPPEGGCGLKPGPTGQRYLQGRVFLDRIKLG